MSATYPYKTAAEAGTDPNTGRRLILTLGSGTTAGVGTGLLLDALKKKKLLPAGINQNMLMRLGPAIAGIGGSTLGRFAGSEIYPEIPAVDPQIAAALKKIDLPQLTEDYAKPLP
jgi:hypothetical protein